MDTFSLKPGIENDHPYDISNQWDIISIKNYLLKAQSDKTLPFYPLDRVEIHPVSACQNKCLFCYGLHLKPGKLFELPLRIIEKNILEDIRLNKKFRNQDPLIILAGLYSEPLLYSEIKKLIKILGKLRFRFGIYTNGIIFDEEIQHLILQSAKFSKSPKASYVSFNIAAALENGYYPFLIKKIKDFIKLRNKIKSPLYINAPFLINKYATKAKIEFLQKSLFKTGVDTIRYSFPQEPIKPNSLSNNQAIKMLKKFRSLRERNKSRVYYRSLSAKPFNHCFVLSNSVSTDPKGNVYPCSQTCTSYFKKLSYGSVKEKKISEIWRSEKHVRLFKNFDPQMLDCRCNNADEQFNRICANFYY